jgi:hypothetical protein
MTEAVSGWRLAVRKELAFERGMSALSQRRTRRTRSHEAFLLTTNR